MKTISTLLHTSVVPAYKDDDKLLHRYLLCLSDSLSVFAQSKNWIRIFCSFKMKAHMCSVKKKHVKVYMHAKDESVTCSIGCIYP